MKIDFNDITWEEKIAFQNVVSFRKKIHYSQMESEFKNFVTQVVAEGYVLKGPFFYSLNNVPLDEMVDIEMFFPVYENQKLSGNEASKIQFTSYFEISPVFRGIVVEDFENQTERLYAKLIHTLEINNLEINTPFFHVTAKDSSKYMNIYLGYVSKDLLATVRESEYPIITENFGF